MNILKILAVITIIAAVAIAAVYLMGMFEQTKPIADAATGAGTQIMDYAKSNIPTIVAAGGTLTALGGVALSKITAAKQQATAISTSANTEISKAIDAKDQITNQLNTAKTQLTSTQTELTTVKTFAEKQVIELTQQNRTLTGQLQLVQDENAQFVKSLMQASNGALVTNPVDGKIYSVLKLPPEIQVK